MIAEINISDVQAIISSIVAGTIAIIGAIVGAVVTIRSAQRTAAKERQKSQDATNKKLDVIHQDTNGNLSKVTKELADLRKLVEKNSASGTVTEP